MPFPLLAAGAALASNLVGDWFQGQQNKSLASYQNDLNMQAWMQQQEYNSPKNQMARFREAGLNPNLIYGQGNSGNAASPVQLNAPQPAPFRNSFNALATQADQYLDKLSKVKNLEIQDNEISRSKSAAEISHDQSVQSAFNTYGTPNRNVTGGTSFSGSPFVRGLGYSLDVKEAELKRRLLINRLEAQFRESERQTQLDRSKQAYELERYTRDPLFYYGNKAVEKLLDFVPKYKGSFRKGVSRR